MSKTPVCVAPREKDPTSVGLDLPLKLANPSCHELPQGKRVASDPLRAANSHSSSVGNRYFTPSRLESHWAKSSASFTETLQTGQCSRPLGGSFPFHGFQ